MEATQPALLALQSQGSYIRGANVFNDVDFIVAPPCIVTDEQVILRFGTGKCKCWGKMWQEVACYKGQFNGHCTLGPSSDKPIL
eukprot:1040059-Pelagomonas_calceolata.AAC.4